MREKIASHLIGLLIWLWVFFSPAAVYIAVIGFFIVGDTILGIMSAKKLGTLDHKVSRRLRPALDKFIGYAVAIMVALVIEKFFIPDFPSLKLISGYLAFIEIKSIDENFETLYGFSIFKMALAKLKQK